MPPFDDIGDAMGYELLAMIVTGFELAMRAIWDASLLVLRGGFGLADRFSMFTIDTRSGPIAALWPLMLWIGGVIALGLFFWQLVLTNLRGGRGFMRLVGGPVQYGIALAVTIGMVAGFLAAVDGLTSGILEYGLQSKNFEDALKHTTFGDGAVDGVKAVVLGICAFTGVIPAAIGFTVEMLFREAAIHLLAATVPVTAAGLLANITAHWFWVTCRWLLACVAMKPVLAMALTLGVAIAGGAQGLSGLLAGVGVLVISLFCPMVLFRLFAFVDPNSDAGAAFRDALAGLGVTSYGPNNPATMAAGAVGGRGGGGAIEDANTDRFDTAIAGHADDTMDDSDIGHDRSPSENEDDTHGSGSVDHDLNGDSTPEPAANLGRVVASSVHTGPSGSYNDLDESGRSEPDAGEATVMP
ncbi:hypothetical protein AB0A74_26435 [Saccharothrix sp. NPDC042600]|uniref:hypothetical protein n=1 Tax=Saccharothrix TaxID=2071 RepID=UPI0033F6A86D|nr:hypothetical protein GCM10017745_46230 [Saccharothrix mutabilis subsp. capreolus]